MATPDIGDKEIAEPAIEAVAPRVGSARIWGREERLGQPCGDPGRRDRADEALRPVRVKAVDQVRALAPVEDVAAVLADDQVDVRHGKVARSGGL
jgi:hypothetical protein